MTGQPKHRLVVIGDSLAHGFQSAAVFNTHKSFPAILAYEIGWLDQFRFPIYNGPGDGLPLNLESLLRRLEKKFGAKINWWEAPLAAIDARQFMAEVEEYWERGPGSTPPVTDGTYHNLGMYLWDLRDSISWTADNLDIPPPRNNVFDQLIENHIQRSARHVLASARDSSGQALTQVKAAEKLGKDGGIETLIVELGANNALPCIVKMKVVWSGQHFADPKFKSKYTVWRPEHFRSELEAVVTEARKIDAQHVLLATIPHVTVVPLARGVGDPGLDGVYSHYTRIWIPDADFDCKRDPCITGDEAREVNRAIDEYNRAIRETAEAERWRVVDLCGLLDRLKHGQEKLPAELSALKPTPTTAFFKSGPEGRTEGGLFSLDGVHPTTIGYGIVAQEFLKVMHEAGVALRAPGPPRVDFQRLLAMDTLISDPPRSITSSLEILAWLDKTLDFVNQALGTNIGEKVLGKDASFGF